MTEKDKKLQQFNQKLVAIKAGLAKELGKVREREGRVVDWMREFDQSSHRVVECSGKYGNR